MSKLLANEIANYGDDAPIDLKEGLNIPAGKPIQAAGVSGSSGMVLSSTGSSIAWIIPFDGNYNSLTNRPTIPAAQVNSDWNATSGVSVILNKPTVPPLTSLTVNPAGTPALSFNAANGEFTYTPPDLSNYDTAYGWGDHAQAGYLTSLGDAAGVTTQKITNWDASYGWGNHASVGYLTSYSETQTLDDVLTLGASTTRDITTTGKILYSNNYANVVDLPNATTYHGMFAHVHAEGHGYFAHAGAWTQLVDTSSSIDELGDVNTATKQDGYVLKWDAASSNWKPAPDLVGTSNAGITLVDLSVQTATASSTPALSYSNTTGVFTYTPPDLSSYLTSYTETDPVFGASAAAGIQSSNISNWDAAHGWGNHANAGYLTSLGDAAGVTTTKISNWDTAYGWGDHGAAGYLTQVSLNGITDVSITSLQTNDVLQYNGSAWVNAAVSGGGGGASVTISDTPPAASAGDLWWESDTGRLKIYYQDTDSSQWVDTSPPLADATTIGGSGTVSMMAHILPDTNAAHDIGSAEYKIRHLFLSDNTLYHEGPFIKTAQHDAGGSAQTTSYVITLAKLKEALNASSSFEDFKSAILAITDA